MTLRSELDSLPFGRTHFAILALSVAIVILDGYDILITAYSMPAMAREWGLTPTLAGSLVSIGLAGLALGSIFGSVIADRIGRKTTLIGSLLLASFASVATASSATSYSSFLPLRFITGLGLGVLLPLASVYVNEFAPSRMTHTLVGIAQTGFGIGGMLAAILGIKLVPDYGWRILYWMGSIGAVIGVACLWILPETPQFLLGRNDISGLRKLMIRLDPAQKLRFSTITFALEIQKRSTRVPIASLLAPGIRVKTICIWLCAFFLVLATHGATAWIPSTMLARGASHTHSFALGGMLQAAGLFGCVFIGWIADKWKRPRTVMAATMLIAGLAEAAIAAADMGLATSLLILILGFFLLGTHPTYYSFVATLYPTKDRATAVGTMLGIGRFGGMCGPLFGGALIQAWHSQTLVFIAFACSAAAAAIALACIPLGRRSAPSDDPTVNQLAGGKG